MRGGHRVALSELDKDLPFFVSYNKKLLKNNYFTGSIFRSMGHVPSLTQHISQYGLAIVEKLENYMMTLENNRLPKQKTFILAVRTKCLASQRTINSSTREFCRKFSLRTTKSNTGLEFLGSGLKYFDREQSKIKGVMFSFQLYIPILDDVSLPQFQIVNLGRFVDSNRIKKAILPAFAVKSRSGTIEPLNRESCFDLHKSLICPSNAISAHDDCLQSIYDTNNTSICKIVIVNSQISCQTQTFPKFLVVTSYLKSKVIFNSLRNRHLAENRLIHEFDVIERINFNGVFYCSGSKDKNLMLPVNVPKTSNYVKSSFFDEYYQFKPNLTISLPDTTTTKLQSIVEKLNDSQNEMIRTALDTLALHNRTTNGFGSRLEKIEYKVEGKFGVWIHRIVTWIAICLIIGK